MRDKVRIRFRKDGDLRLVSHHDLMQCFERMLRRAEIPFCTTNGFNPQPRLVFALSLPLGIVGADEVVELEMKEELPAEEVCRRLRQQAPAGLDFLSARRIDPKAHGQPCRVRYRVEVPLPFREHLPAQIDRLLACSEHWIERTRPHARRINLRAFLADLRLVGPHLEMDIRVTPQGTARAEEVLVALGLGELPDNGAILERTNLELDDELLTPGANEVPTGPASNNSTARPVKGNA
jgi:radical SAM-linked protein